MVVVVTICDVLNSEFKDLCIDDNKEMCVSTVCTCVGTVMSLQQRGKVCLQKIGG